MMVLLGVVAWASFSIIDHIDSLFSGLRYESAIRELSIAVWSLTMGVMFLTGAFGLWAIRSSVEIEGRRRIGRFVSAMDYLSDGLVLLDKNGRIVGFNPSLSRLLPTLVANIEATLLTDLFPCVSRKDLDCLMDLSAPRELERDCAESGVLRTLRFRSQPSSGVRLVLISDVTDTRSEEIRRRQVALLQLVGRIAGGVAHDFNNILCAISGHAALIARAGANSDAIRDSLEVIQNETQKGAVLSRQLLGLSQAGMRGQSGAHIEHHLAEAVELLRLGLDPAWKMKIEADGVFPPVPLSAGQIEQIVLNLGLLAADAQPRPGILVITLNRPGFDNLADAPDGMAVVILIVAESPECPGDEQIVKRNGTGSAVPTLAGTDEGGVILSVVQSLVLEAQGTLDQFVSDTGNCIYRVCLPHLALSESTDDSSENRELADYLAGWKVVLAATDNTLAEKIGKQLRNTGVVLVRRDSISTLLGKIDYLGKIDAVILDVKILEKEIEGLFKAILKLCPQVGILALCDDPDSSDFCGLKNDIAFVAYDQLHGQIARLLIIAKALRSSQKATKI